MIEYVSKWKDHGVREKRKKKSIHAMMATLHSSMPAKRTIASSYDSWLKTGADPSLQAAKQSVPLLAWIILQHDPRSFKNCCLPFLACLVALQTNYPARYGCSRRHDHHPGGRSSWRRDPSKDVAVVYNTRKFTGPSYWPRELINLTHRYLLK